MKKIQSTLLASSLIAALFFSTAYAATSGTDTNPHKMRDLVEAYQSEQTDRMEDSRFDNMGKQKPLMMKKNGGPWRLLAELTGKDVASIKQDCRTNHKLPYTYAKEHGVEIQFQARQLAAVKNGLHQAVSNGKITQEEADSALRRFNKFQSDEAAGKVVFPRGHEPFMMGNKHPGMADGPHFKQFGRAKGLMPFDTLAKLTGKDVDELMSICRNEQKNCYDIAKDNGVLKEYKEKRIAANKEFLAKLVADDKISQEKADKILTKVEKNIHENKPERKHLGKGPEFPNPKPMPPMEY